MKRRNIVVLAILLATSSLAFGSLSLEPMIQSMIRVARLASASNLGWRVGDKLAFDLRLKPIPKVFTASLEVTKETAQLITLTETLDLKVIKQVIETDMDKDTGEIRHMRVNGKEQPVSKIAGGGGTSHVVKMEESRVKVPAGEFDAIYVVTEDANHNQAEAWINPMEVPISGIIKSKQVQGDLITVVMELRSFARGH